MAMVALAAIGSLCIICICIFFFKRQHIDFCGTNLDGSHMYAGTDGRTTTDIDCTL